MHYTYQITGPALIGALTGIAKTVNKPRFLRDVLAIKKDRGDEDCAYLALSRGCTERTETKANKRNGFCLC